MPVTKRCAVCTRVRAYEEEDAFCISCGSEALEDRCECGRAFDYALEVEGSEMHCPRCGRSLRGRASEFRA